MYTDDGEFFNRIKSILKTGEVPVLPKKVLVETAVAAGDILLEEPEEQLAPENTLKDQILTAMTERTTLVNYYENISLTPPIPTRTVNVTAPTITMPEEKDLDIRFATKFISAGGKFVFCENLKDAVDSIKSLKIENGWGHVFCWENEIKDAFNENNFQRGSVGFTIENSDAAISLCESLIADEGIIVLNPKQASRRRLPCFPKIQIILTDIAHLTGSESEGLEQFFQKHKGELPSIIKLGSCNNGHFYDKQRLILNAEGPEDIYVFLVDEIIPPSLRP